MPFITELFVTFKLSVVVLFVTPKLPVEVLFVTFKLPVAVLFVTDKLSALASPDKVIVSATIFFNLLSSIDGSQLAPLSADGSLPWFGELTPFHMLPSDVCTTIPKA